MTEQQTPKEQVLDDKDRDEAQEAVMRLGSKIRPYMSILARVPTSDLEKAFQEEELPEWLWENKEMLSQAENLLENLQVEYRKKEEDIKMKWAGILSDWTKLCEDGDHRLGYSIVHPDVVKTLSVLEAVLAERSEEKMKRLVSIRNSILNLRAQLEAIWTACHVSEEEKLHFMSQFTSERFSEDLHEAHKEELRIWTHYQQKNQVLMEKVARREQMWNEMIELEHKAEDPARFVNRGASLLKDQQTLTFIRKNLPKVEQELVKLATNFAVEHGRSFKIQGQEMHEKIAADWKNFNEEKAGRKYLRGSSANLAPAVSTGHGIALATPRKRAAGVTSHPPSAKKPAHAH